MDVVKQSEPKPYKNYRWIIADPEWLSAGMTVDDINESFGGGVTPEAIQEALSVTVEAAHQ